MEASNTSFKTAPATDHPSVHIDYKVMMKMCACPQRVGVNRAKMKMFRAVGTFFKNDSLLVFSRGMSDYDEVEEKNSKDFVNFPFPAR